MNSGVLKYFLIQVSLCRRRLQSELFNPLGMFYTKGHLCIVILSIMLFLTQSSMHLHTSLCLTEFLTTMLSMLTLGGECNLVECE